MKDSFLILSFLFLFTSFSFFEENQAQLNINEISLLHQIVQEGDLENLKIALDEIPAEQRKSEINKFNEQGKTALHVAVEAGHIEVVLELIQQGAEIDKKTENEGWTALHIAVQEGHELIVSSLLNLKADLNLQDGEGYAAIYHAVSSNNLNLINLLVQAGADLSLQDHNRRTIFHHVSILGESKALEILLRKTTSLMYSEDALGHTPLSYLSLNGSEQGLRVFDTIRNQEAQAKTLHQAAQDGDIDRIRAILSKFNTAEEIIHEVNTTNEQGETALHIAVGAGHFATMFLLIEYGAIVNVVNLQGKTPLHIAARLGYAKIVAHLLDEKGNLNSQDDEGLTPLMLALVGGSLEVVRLLGEAGASLNLKDYTEKTVFHHASILNKAGALVYLLEKTTDFINEKDVKGYTPLHYAVLNDSQKVLEVLQDENGVQVDAKDNSGKTALFLAAEKGNKWMVELLLKMEAHPGSITNENVSPLSMAVINENLELIRAFINAGASFRLTEETKQTVFHTACILDKGDVLGVLLEEAPLIVKRYINQKDVKGYTPLHYAVLNNSQKVLEVLQDENVVQVDVKDNSGKTALFLAAEKGDIPTVKTLFEMEAHPDLQDKLGHNPLYVAMAQGNVELIRVLMSANASVYWRDEEGKTVFHHASILDKGDVLGVLLEKPTRLTNEKDAKGYTPLHYAVLNNSQKAFQVLLDDQYIDVDVQVDFKDSKKGNKEDKKKTALFLAVERGKNFMVERLLASEAHPDLANRKGFTPLMMSASQGNYDLSKILLNAGASQNSIKKALNQAKRGKHQNIVFLLEHVLNQL